MSATYGGSSAHSSSNGSHSLTATKRASSTTVSCSPSSLTPGASTTCTAEVNDTTAPGTKSLPTGTVTWTNGSTCTLSQKGGGPNALTGTCGVSVTAQSTPGTQTVTGTYLGDAKHSGSNASTNFTVSGTATTTTVDCGAADVAVGDSRTCGATVQATSGTPTGSVSWSTDKSGSTFSSTACTLSSGACSTGYTPAPGSQGVHTVTGSYAGNSTYLASSGNATVNAVKRTSQTRIACGSDHTINVESTCTVTVTDAGLTPTGSVDVTLDGNALGSCTLSNGACDVTYTPAAGTAGQDILGATYSGDANHNGSNGSQNVTVAKRASTTSIVEDTCQNGPVDAAVTCSITVTDGTASGTAITPAGTVSYTVGEGTDSTSCPAGSAGYVCTFTPGSVGTHALNFAYSGGTNHTASSTSTSMTASTRSTSTTVSCGTPSAVIFEARDCTVTVTDTESAGTSSAPAGDVSVSVNDVAHETCTLVAAAAPAPASSSCAVSYTGNAVTAAGTPLSITAAYAGQAKHAGSSTGQPATLAIIKADQTITFDGLSNKAFGAAPFEVSALSSSGLSVSFTAPAEGPCSVEGLTVTITGAGTCTITASQAGNENYNPASDVSKPFTVAKANQASLSLTGVPASATYGDVITPGVSGGSGTGGYSISLAAGSTCAFDSVDPSKVRMTSIGTCTVVGTRATDTNYNVATTQQSVTVSGWTFGGFKRPVDGGGVLNRAKAGSAIPVKFDLGGDKGLSIFKVGSPTSGVITCSASAVVDTVEETVNAGSSSLSYDPISGQYNYVWKTDTRWAGQCRQLVLKFADGQTQTANFHFTK